MQTLEERNIGVYDPYDLTDKLVGKEINVRFWIPEVVDFKKAILTSTKIPSCKKMKECFLNSMKTSKNFKSLLGLEIYGPIGSLRKYGWLRYPIKYNINGITDYDYISIYKW